MTRGLLVVALLVARTVRADPGVDAGLTLTAPERPDLRLPEAPSITDGQNIRLAPMIVPQSKQEADRRPIYIGFGVVIIALAFWWNRRQRERFDRADAGDPREPTPERDDSAATDDDADDLHAAARGDSEKDKA